MVPKYFIWRIAIRPRGCYYASTFREFLSTWSKGGPSLAFLEMHRHTALAYFPHENKAYLTSPGAPLVARGWARQLLAPNHLPNGVVLSEWAQRWVSFVKEAGVRGDVVDDVVDGHRFLPHDVH